jgi:hypothetical protein
MLNTLPTDDVSRHNGEARSFSLTSQLLALFSDRSFTGVVATLSNNTATIFLRHISLWQCEYFLYRNVVQCHSVKGDPISVMLR